MKFTALPRAMMLSIALTTLLTSGCGKLKDAAERTKKFNELKHLGVLYQIYMDTYGGKGPSNVDDLLKLTSGDLQAAQGVQLVKSGKYVLVWGMNRNEMLKSPVGLWGSILGYENGVPTSGGLVLMGDGSVKNMTSAEFQSAPKPPTN